MKPIYVTLDSYNQYMEETRDTVLMCPELSEYGMDEGEDFSQRGTIYFDADLEGAFLEPAVRTPASGTLYGIVESTGLTVLLKVRRLSSVTRVSLHRLEDEAIGPEAVILYDSIRNDTLSGTLLSRRVAFSEFLGTPETFIQRLDSQMWGIVVYTVAHPQGEIAGFLQKTLFA